MVVLDISNYDQPTFNAQCFKDAGVTDLIVGCQWPGIAEVQIQQARGLGIGIKALYGFDYFLPGPGFGYGDINHAILLALKYGVKRVYIDCEIDAAPDSVDDRNAEVRECVRLIEGSGLEAGIYTAPWWWVPNHGNTNEFCRLPLWFARYGSATWTIPPIQHLGILSFGGWTECVTHQYTSTLNICGRDRDANYVFEEDDMADPRVDEILKALTGNATTDLQMKRLAEWNVNGNSLLDGYTGEQQKLADHIANHPSGTAASAHTHVTGPAVEE